MGTRVSYPAEVKLKAIERRLDGIPVKEVMAEFNILNRSQLKTWMKWYRNGELHRLYQPVGKPYTNGQTATSSNEMERIQTENRYLKQQIDVLKKYKELERKWYQK